jgi:outer membrane protein OmpA-like peptidoglycan-associated protein
MAPGLLVPHASKKLLIANQVVALSESISIKAPAGYTFLDLVINGKRYKVATTDLTNILLPVLVGPKDKVIVELVDADGNVLQDPITQQSSNVALANVNFDLSKYSLTKAAKKALDNVAKVDVQHGYTFIDLTGYTDAQGVNSKFNNQKLSQQRGQMTAAYLKTKLGKAKIAIKVEAKAHSNPVASNSTSAGQAMNRRVEISVH